MLFAAMAQERETIRNPNLTTFIVLVSILSIVNTILVYIPATDPALAEEVRFFNVALSIVFVINFLYRLTTAKSKAEYLRSGNGITDLLACIPFIEVAWIFRGLKVFWVLNKLGYHQFKKGLSREQAEAVVYLYLFIIILVLEFGAYGVLVAERSDPSSTIKTAGQSLWYSYVTITTVGYGDYTPITPAGRAIGTMIMTAGIGTFAILIGYFAKRLVGEKEEKEESAQNVTPDSEEITSNQESLKKSIRELSERMGRIEQLLTSQSREDRK